MISTTLGITITKTSMGIMFMIGMMTMINIGDNIISMTGSFTNIIGMMSTTTIIRTMMRMISTTRGITITKTSMGIMFMIGMMSMINIGDNIISMTGSLTNIIGM